MPRYQIHLAVDVECNDEDDAFEVGEHLEEFLGLHFETASKGCVTEVVIMEEDNAPLVPDHEFMVQE